MELVGFSSLNEARTYFSAKNYGRSYAHYLVALEVFPDQRTVLKNEFFKVLWLWTSHLEAEKRIEDLLLCLENAYRYYPHCQKLQAEIGLKLLRLEEEDVALLYLEKYAPNFNQTDLLIRNHLMAAKLMVVARWHYSMLNDKRRNEAYKAAIENTAKSSNRTYRVLDIGCGCALLSMFCAEHNNVKEITAIEMSKTMANIAEEVIKSNRFQSKIRLVNTESTKLENVKRSNMLVTEIFDAALFGEHALKTILHAWENLLEENSVIIPASARVFLTGIKCDSIVKQYFFDGTIPGTGFPVTLILDQEQPYEVENLRNLNVDYITNTEEILQVDFSNRLQLQQLYNNNNQSIATVVLKVIKRSVLHAFALWFDLHLTETIKVTTNPMDENCVHCWQQAIFYPEHPFQVEENQELILDIFCINGALKIVLKNPLEQLEVFKVSQKMISQLNDDEYLKTIAKLPRHYEKVADVNEFPLFGLLSARNGSRTYTVLQSEKDEVFFKHVAEKMGCLNNVIVCDNNNQVLDCNYDVLFFNPINEDGNVHNEVTNLQIWREVQCYPTKVILLMKIIESNYLRYNNRVYDSRVSDYKISDHINRYAVEQHGQIKLDHFKYKTLSELRAWTLPNLFNNDESVTKKFSFQVVKKGRADGILYWFNLEYRSNTNIDTFNSHHSKCCYVFRQDIPVQSGSSLDFDLKYESGLIDFF